MNEYNTTPSGLSNSAIADYAERVGEAHAIYDSNGRADIDRLISNLSGSVAFAQGSESLTIEDDGSFRIFLPEHTSARRDRFTKSHEIGHYFLHYLYPRELRDPQRKEEKAFGRGERNRAETEANIFASSLLMPSAQFEEAFRLNENNFDKIARIFDVSPMAAEVRARVLGIAED